MKTLAYISFIAILVMCFSWIVKLVSSLGFNFITVILSAICLIPVFMAAPFIGRLLKSQK